MVLVQIIPVERMEFVKKLSTQIIRHTFALAIVVIMAFNVNLTMTHATIIVHQNQFANQTTVGI
jgi:hypothetical protein